MFAKGILPARLHAADRNPHYPLQSTQLTPTSRLFHLQPGYQTVIYVLPNIPESLSRAICADLIGNLPDPAEDTPEQRAIRDERAITALAHYIPENAAEAELAADACHRARMGD